MIKNLKKAFTIIELVIVIAVIAILAAVMIPTYSSLAKKANVSKDTQLVRNLNTALASDLNEHNTMYDALEAAAVNGYDVAKINASATDNEILWDSVNDVFCYLNGNIIEYIPNTKVDKKVEDYQYWQICSEEPTTQKYSIYWNSEDDFSETLNVGFDAGENTTITSLSYENKTDEVKAVTIRTNSGTLTIDATPDTVNHYGTAGVVNIKGIAKDSYHLFGKVNTLQIKKGHVVIENNASTTNVIVESDESNSENAPTVDNKGTIENVIGNSEKVSGKEPNNKMTNDKKELTTDGGYVKLENDQTITADLTLANDTILDLNGHTITFSEGKGLTINSNTTIIDSSSEKTGKISGKIWDDNFIKVSGENANLTINSGEIVSYSKKGANGYKAMIHINGSATFVMNGGKTNNMQVSDYNDWIGPTILVTENDTKCYINGGEIYCEKNFTLAGNGTESNWGTYIEINGGIIKSNDVTIYHPQVGTLIITGGYIEGLTAIYQKAGTMTITGGTFKATGKHENYSYNGNGADATGDCIVIDSCKGYGNEATSANINLDETNIMVTDSTASKVYGYTYGSDNTAIIIWNGEQVKSIKK